MQRRTVLVISCLIVFDRTIRDIANSFLFLSLRLSTEKNNSAPSSVLSGSNVQIESAIIVGEGHGLLELSLNDFQIIPNPLQKTSPFYIIIL